MSHMTRRTSQMSDVEAIKAACQRVNARYLGLAKGKGGGMENEFGHQVHLSGWEYPVTIHQETGECKFDNYNGRWGDIGELESLQQGYGVEAAKAQAEADGHTFSEEVLPNGDIKCTIPIGGGSGYDTGDNASVGGWDV